MRGYVIRKHKVYKDKFIVVNKDGSPVKIKDIDTWTGDDIIATLLFQKDEAVKMQRIMNLTKTDDLIDWKLMNRITKSFDIVLCYTSTYKE